MTEETIAIFMFVLLVCVTIMSVSATIMLVYLLFSHCKDVYNKMKRSKDD
jgi:hypothetical protein